MPVVDGPIYQESHLLRGIEYPTHAVYSYLVSPMSIIVLRAVWILFTFSIFIISLVDWYQYGGAVHGLQYFFIFTYLNFMGLLLYLCVRVTRISIADAFEDFHCLVLSILEDLIIVSISPPPCCFLWVMNLLGYR
jgi:hypothetical protein